MLVSALDRTAIGLSVLCVLHCLALPLALIAGSSLTAFWFADEIFHQLLVFLVLPTSIIGLMLGCKRHKAWAVLAWGLCGVSVLAFAALFGHDVAGEIGEKIFTVLGSILVVVGHVLNFRLCRSVDCDHELSGRALS